MDRALGAMDPIQWRPVKAEGRIAMQAGRQAWMHHPVVRRSPTLARGSSTAVFFGARCGLLCVPTPPTLSSSSSPTQNTHRDKPLPPLPLRCCWWWLAVSSGRARLEADLACLLAGRSPPHWRADRVRSQQVHPAAAGRPPNQQPSSEGRWSTGSGLLGRVGVDRSRAIESVGPSSHPSPQNVAARRPFIYLFTPINQSIHTYPSTQTTHTTRDRPSSADSALAA